MKKSVTIYSNKNDQTNIKPEEHWVETHRQEIQQQFQQYLEEFNIKSKEELIDNNESSPKEKIFLAAVRDFVNFKISYDMFGTVLGMVWKTNDYSFNTVYQTKVEDMSFWAFELQWYLRHNPKAIIVRLADILEYYEENKHKIGVK